jgi:hypothetical protein
VTRRAATALLRLGPIFATRPGADSPMRYFRSSCLSRRGDASSRGLRSPGTRRLLRADTRLVGKPQDQSKQGNTDTFQDFTHAKRLLDRLSGVTDWRLHDLRRQGTMTLPGAQRRRAA